ncbi:uncharacterized protein BJ171DRAFT_485778 [Polychytrium aggregatum]|uniref:uncharacterized protein n=1 Tax=Polychytrium aggregatum TaxID=110093 RepID=UPI0022FF4384|nr:uncharacterized protein BJ171DRAFT_485778 [Polychytrium aggregatum]KAI9209220.1 hypothetical protein BJ171DRAFT_485778 [Polychytrium aggregatum]
MDAGDAVPASPALDRYLSQYHVAWSFADPSFRTLRAQIRIPAGTVLLPNRALAVAGLSSQVCHGCVVSFADSMAQPLRCAACQQAFYCSKKCQKSDWSLGHKSVCAYWRQQKLLPSDRQVGQSDDPSSASNAQREIIEKDTEMLLKTIAAFRNPADPAVQIAREVFVQLMSHLDECEPPLRTQFHEIAEQTVKMDPPGLAQVADHYKLPHYADDARHRSQLVETLAQFLAVYRCNNFSMHDSQLFVYGEGTFPIGALMNHSCLPNCAVLFDGQMQYFRTLRDIDAGEELTDAYVDGMDYRPDRQTKLLDKYRFSCRCDRCEPLDSSGFSVVDRAATKSHCDPESILGDRPFVYTSMMSSWVPAVLPAPQRRDSCVGDLASFLRIVLDDYRELFLVSDHQAYRRIHLELAQRIVLPPSRQFLDLSLFTQLSTELYTAIDANDWHKAAVLSLYVLAVYLLFYERHHPMVGLQWLLCGKCLWNASDSLDDDTDRQHVVIEARMCLETAVRSLGISHGSEGLGNRLLLADAAELLQVVQTELSTAPCS